MQMALAAPHARTGSAIATSPRPDGRTVTTQAALLPFVLRRAFSTAPPVTSSSVPATVR